MVKFISSKNNGEKEESRKGAEDFIIEKNCMPLTCNFTKAERPYDAPKKP